MDDPNTVLGEFDYRPQKILTVALFLLALAGMVMLTYFALYLDKPIEIAGIKLTLEQSRLFFAALALFATLGVAALGTMLYATFAFDRKIAVTETHIILPKPTVMGLSREQIAISFSDIESVSVLPFMGTTEILRLDRYVGKPICIPSNMLQSSKVFQELYCLIHQRVHPNQHNPC